MILLSALATISIAQAPATKAPIDDRVVLRAGFRFKPTSQFPNHYTRRSDGARIRIENVIASSPGEAYDIFQRYLSMEAVRAPERDRLPSGRPLGRTWQYYPGAKGKSGIVLNFVGGRSFVTISLLYNQVRKDGRNLWKWYTGNLVNDRVLVERLARDILRRNERTAQ
ncbi:MAG: hypothetical protein ACO1SV_16625 [Fimbriimonas sp.]